jgi:dihydroorotate dehydrogenase
MINTGGKMYKGLRSILFACDPEWSHTLALSSLKLLEPSHILQLLYPRVKNSLTKLGLELDNPVGLAAGLDKDGQHLKALWALGFGYLEIGTVTPMAQVGNAKPRLFRLTQDQAIINRMGFNNLGVGSMVNQLSNTPFNGVLGVNIGKNKVTPNEKALQDYEICFEALYPYADYMTVNISSPNTPGLRDMQTGEALMWLLEGLSALRKRLAAKGKRQACKQQAKVPLLLKLAPDLSEEALHSCLLALVEAGWDGVVLTNTTTERPSHLRHSHQNETGGLSGRPLTTLAQSCLQSAQTFLEQKNLRSDLTLIGVGGIFSQEDALARQQAGADLVQIYSGLIYEGPKLIGDIAHHWRA